MTGTDDPTRRVVTRRVRQLEYFAIGWNTIEGVVGVIAGVLAGSASLAGFGGDSAIEVGSALALLWRMSIDVDVEGRERRERVALRVVGGCFLLLAGYVGVEASLQLVRREPPESSVLGIAVTFASIVVMPILARAKRRAASTLQSRALGADARQADFCAYLSAIVIAGLLLNRLLGWWWADPVSGLVMVPIIAREGIRAVRGDPCCDSCG